MSDKTFSEELDLFLAKGLNPLDLLKSNYKFDETNASPHNFALDNDENSVEFLEEVKTGFSRTSVIVFGAQEKNIVKEYDVQFHIDDNITSSEDTNVGSSYDTLTLHAEQTLANSQLAIPSRTERSVNEANSLTATQPREQNNELRSTDISNDFPCRPTSSKSLTSEAKETRAIGAKRIKQNRKIKLADRKKCLLFHPSAMSATIKHFYSQENKNVRAYFADVATAALLQRVENLNDSEIKEELRNQYKLCNNMSRKVTITRQRIERIRGIMTRMTHDGLTGRKSDQGEMK